MRYFNVRIENGYSTTCLFTIYYDSVNVNNRALLYNVTGTTEPAINLTYGQLTTPTGVLVGVPDSMNEFIVFDQCGICPPLTGTTTPYPTPTPTPTVDCSLEGNAIYVDYTGATVCASFEPLFNEITHESVGYVYAGNIIVASGNTLNSYVIEWRYGSADGVTKFVSGSSGTTDTDITKYHPFMTTGATGNGQLVESGTYYPVLRQITINGVKYTSSNNGNGIYSPDLKTCLSSVVVQTVIVTPFTCTTGVTDYTTTIIYNNVQDTPIEAEQIISYKLNTDGSTAYVAVNFTAEEVIDQLMVYYVTTGGTEDLIENWRVGVGTVPPTYKYIPGTLPNPITIGDYNYQYVINLIDNKTYTNGDSLKFKIFPKVLYPTNVNTNWSIGLKCLIASDFNCSTDTIINPDWGTIDPNSFVMSSFDSANCRYRLDFRVMGVKETGTNVNYHKYISTDNYGYKSYDSNYSSVSGTTYLYFRSDVYGHTVNYLPEPYQYTGETATLVKTSSPETLTITFSGGTNAYTQFKNSYITTTGNTNMTGYTSDVTNINHYKGIYFLQDVAYDIDGITPLPCGDVGVTKNLSFHYSSSVVFDDTNKIITIVPVLGVNGYTGGTECDFSVTSVDVILSQLNSLYYRADFTDTIICSRKSPFAGYYATTGSTNDSVVNIYYSEVYSKHGIDNLCATPPISGFNESTSTSKYGDYYMMYKYGLKIQITNENYFKVYDLKQPDGSIDFNSTNLIYQIP